MLLSAPKDRRVTLADLAASAVELGLRLVDDPIQPGDLYLAGRNTGVHLLTCKSVEMTAYGTADWINSVEIAYAYDAGECRKVVALEAEALPAGSLDAA